jgi:hypothetical protein
LIEEVQAMPPFQQVPEQPYSAILQRVGTGLAFRKVIVPEVITPDLSEKDAAAVWRFWAEQGPASWRKDLDAQT